MPTAETPKHATLTGRTPATLANEVSDAINKALRAGMEPDAAISVAMQVLIDHACHAYGPSYPAALARVIPAMVERSLLRDQGGSHANR